MKKKKFPVLGFSNCAIRLSVWSAFVALCPTLSVAQTPCVNLLLNPSFEEGPLADGVNLYPESAIPGWKLASSVKAGTKPAQFKIYKNTARKAADGIAYIELDSSKNVYDDIYQDVMTEPNTLYELRYYVSKLPELGATDSSVVYVYWDADAEGGAGGYAGKDPVKWVYEVDQLNSGAGGLKRISLREEQSEEPLFAGDGRSPLIDGLSLCKIGPWSPPSGRVKGPPLNRRIPEHTRRVSRVLGWIFPGSGIRRYGDKVEALYFSDSSPITGAEDLVAASKNFLLQYEEQLGLKGLSSQLDGGKFEGSYQRTVFLKQFYQGYETGSGVTFIYDSSRKLKEVEIPARVILSTEPVEFPQDTSAALQVAIKLVRAEHLTGVAETSFIKKKVFVDYSGNARPVFQIWMSHPQINWMVEVDAQNGKTYWTQDLQTSS